MKPTNEQIIFEAKRRWGATPSADMTTIEDFIIEVVRENWTPPEPEPVVDPDLIAWRYWIGQTYPDCAHMFDCWEIDGLAEHFIAGARMARNQEQERKREYVDAKSSRAREFRATLAKYRGEW